MRAESGLQQAKSARARESICAATIRMLARYGYAETTISGVAALAEVSKGAVQYHFPSKEDLIAATVDTLLIRTIEGVKRPASVEDALMGAWQKFINTSAYRALLEVLNAARTDGALRARIADELYQWGQRLDDQSRSHYRATSGNDQDAVMLMNMTRSFMRGLLIQEQYGISQETILDYVKKWVELIAPQLELRDAALDTKS